MRIALVTGGAGFIGSHLVERLLRDNWRVRVLDNFSTGTHANLEWARGEVELWEGDVRDAALCARAAVGAESVFHLAAIASVPSSVADPMTSHEVTLGGTLNVLMAARDGGARRVVFSSSASIYGDADQSPTPESAPLRPQSPYASAKAASELYCRNFHELYGLETVVLRYFNVFGPRQGLHSGYAAAIPKFIHAAVTGGTPIVYGDGLQTRDFVYVGNVAEANLRAAEAEGVAGMAFNIAGGGSVTILQVLAELGSLAGRPLVIEHRPGRAGEVRHSEADISLARRCLGFTPGLSLREGLALTLKAAQGEKEPAQEPAPVRPVITLAAA